MKKRLVKSKQRVIFGVCGGIADYFEIDPTIVRAGTCIAFLCFGVGLLAYVIGAIVMPSE